MRWLIALVVMGALVVAVDMVARNVAEDRMSERLSARLDDAEDVDVDLGGAFFIPQVLSGDFGSLVISADTIGRSGLPIDDLQVTLRGVRFSLDEVVDGGGGVTVRGGSGRGFISEESLEMVLAERGFEGTVELADGMTLSARGVEATVEDIAIDPEDATLSLTAPPLEPLVLDLPAPVRRIDYSGAKVVGDRLRVDFEVDEGTFSL